MGLTDYPSLKDLLLIPRRKYFYGKRIVLASAMGLIILSCSLFFRNADLMGLRIFRTASYFLLFTLAVITPFTAGQSVLMEKLNRTLGLLWLTEIKPYQLVFGKFSSVLFSTVCNLLIALPVFMLALTLGGVSSIQLGHSLMILLGIIYSGTCLGMMLGAFCASERSLFSSAIGLTAGLHLLVPLLVSAAQKSIVLPASEFDAFSAFSAMRNAIGAINMQVALYNVGWNFTAGTIMLLLAAWKIPRLASRPPAEKQKRKSLLRRSIKFSPVKGNVISWKDAMLVYGSKKREFAFATLVMLISSSLIIPTLLLKGNLDDLRFLGYFLALIGMMFMMVLLMLRACRSFNVEWESRTVEMLLVSDVSDSEFVRGKYLALLHSAFPWFVMSGLCAIASLLATITNSDDLLVIAASTPVLTTFLTTTLAMTALAMYFSLYFNTALTFFLSITCTLVWTGCLRSLAITPFTLLATMFIDSNPYIGNFLWVGFILAAALLDIALLTILLIVIRKTFRRSAIKRLLG